MYWDGGDIAGFLGFLASCSCLGFLIWAVLSWVTIDSTPSPSDCSLQSAQVADLWKQNIASPMSFYVALSQDGDINRGVKLGDDTKAAVMFSTLLLAGDSPTIQIEICSGLIDKFSYQGVTLSSEDNLADIGG